MERPLDKNELRSAKISRKEFADIKRHLVYIVLDNLKCAHNVGSIFRLADALLIEKVYLCGKTIIPPNRKITATSRGSEKWAPWEYRDDVVEVVKELEERSVYIVSAELALSSVSYHELDFTLPVCLVLGREYDGVTPEVLKLSDAVVALPIYGMANSLNVSVTAGVLLYEIVRKIRDSSHLPSLTANADALA